MTDDPMRRLRDAIANFPQQVAEAAERARELSRQTVTARSANGAVEVVANGSGEIVSVGILADRREVDSRTLSESVVDAANAALDEVDRMRAAVLPDRAAVRASLAEAERAFNQRMDDLLSRLDGLARDLDRGSR
ncbi:MAG TPA: YbaB/EbfC family nucleoid-associated protein [Micromonosporaceae bacterium]